MALAAEVTARYPGSRLIQLTNPGDQSAAAVDATVLGLAVTDVQADFEIIAGIEYDNSEARHVSVAVWGVIAKLAGWSEAAGSTGVKLHEAWIERLEQLAKVTGRDRVPVTTSSQVTPTDERQTTETVRPWSDHPHFDDLVARPPDN